MGTNQTIAAISALAAAIAEGRCTEEIALIATCFTQLGDTLATIAAQQSFCESICPQKGSKT